MSTTETAPKVHVFAHLGAYPYRYLGFEHKAYQACHGAPVQPGGTCDHCGTPIYDIYSFVSSDGKRFHVGSTCVDKAGDKGLKRVIAADVAKHRKDVAHARQDGIIDRAVAALPAAREALAEQPHPTAYLATQGRTLADWVDWMMEHAGRAGKVKAAHAVLSVRA